MNPLLPRSIQPPSQIPAKPQNQRVKRRPNPFGISASSVHRPENPFQVLLGNPTPEPECIPRPMKADIFMARKRGRVDIEDEDEDEETDENLAVEEDKEPALSSDDEPDPHIIPAKLQSSHIHPHLPPFTDWSLKSSFVFTTTTSPTIDVRLLVSWVGFRDRMSPAFCVVVARGLTKGVKGRENGPMVGSEGDMAFFRTREKEWMVAMRSVFRMLRDAETPYFIYRNEDFSVVFSGLPVHARLSRSTPGIRKLLDLQDIGYTRVGGDELCGLEFGDPVDVHALHDFLLNWTDPRAVVRAQGPPIIYAPVAFLFATKIQAVLHGPVEVVGATHRWRSEVRGICLPPNLYSILEGLEKGDGFGCVFGSYGETVFAGEGRCLKTVEKIGEEVVVRYVE